MNLDNLIRVDLSPAQVLVSYLLAFALAFLWATVYRRTHSGIAYTRSFFFTLVLISPAIAMIMMAIGSNVALSLGLVGALSIVRYRAVIKDSKDLTFLLVSIGIGLTAGANVWVVGLIGTVTLAAITIVMTRAGHSGADSGDYILIFRSNSKEPWEALPPDAQQLIAWKQLRGVTDVDHGQDFEYTYSVRLASKANPERIVGEFSNGIARDVTLITPENHLEL
ncbi:MAG: DUF4956 domain-containing protein [Candidatus Promineifilaceae bacterium]